MLITGVLIEDHGEYKCTTKDDKTMAQLIVDPLNKFIRKLEDQEVGFFKARHSISEIFFLKSIF